MLSFLNKVMAPQSHRILMASQRNFATMAMHSRMPRQKDYYSILDIGRDATPEQIKDAYRTAAKKYHPDVVGGSQPDADKFRDVMEAYAVLSVVQSRANYDLLRRKDPDAFREVNQREFSKSYDASARDKSGNVAMTAPAPGSYAEQRLAELKEQREQYNVNHLGFYRGGVPQKGRGPIRSSAIGRPGEFHSPQMHNFLNFYHPDAKTVTSEDTVKFKAYMLSDKDDFTMSRPAHPMHYDREMNFMKDRNFWLGLLFGICSLMYLSSRYEVEVERMRRWERMGNLENAPAHHYNNRGGVLVKKTFAGFEKYHKNTEEMMDWYKKAYPSLVKN